MQVLLYAQLNVLLDQVLNLCCSSYSRISPIAIFAFAGVGTAIIVIVMITIVGVLVVCWIRNRGEFNNNETLYHIPSSCMVIMVHVVKGRQHACAFTFDALIAEMESLNLERDRS